jgi:hypothetical protein
MFLNISHSLYKPRIGRVQHTSEYISNTRHQNRARSVRHCDWQSSAGVSATRNSTTRVYSVWKSAAETEVASRDKCGIHSRNRTFGRL